MREKLGATEFLGYETETAEGVVAALVKDGEEVATLGKGDAGVVVVNQTPFYGESGGQVGDTGVMSGDGVRFRVTDTQKKAGDLFVHTGTVEEGTLKPGASLTLNVDHDRRSAIRANHSATHLLHEALRQVLGDHVAQKGSLVAPDRLRFDFSHHKPMTADEIERVEDIANEFVIAEFAGDHAPDGARRRDAPPAPARCSAKNTATRCASSRWARSWRYRWQHHGLVGRAVRRHPCAAHRRHRPDRGRVGFAASPPACAGSRR